MGHRLSYKSHHLYFTQISVEVHLYRLVKRWIGFRGLEHMTVYGSEVVFYERYYGTSISPNNKRIALPVSYGNTLIMSVNEWITINHVENVST